MWNLEWRVGLGVVAGAVFGWLWASRPEAWLEVDVLSVLTAFGTVGAVWAAIWAAGRAERLREIEGAERISRASASFAVRCMGISNLLDVSLCTVSRLRGGSHYPDAYRLASEVVEQTINELQHERAAAIAFLPEACSQRVETAIELLRSAQRNIELVEPALAGMNETGVRAVIANVLTWSEPAVELLRAACQECVKISPHHSEYWPRGLKLIDLDPSHYRDE